MTYLEVLDEVPASQPAGPGSIVGVHWDRIAPARDAAQRIAGSNGASLNEQALARAVIDLTDVLAEVVRGIRHGRIGVVGYPEQSA